MPKPEITIVQVDPTPEPESQSVERTLGQLETETEHLSEEVQEATETAEAAETIAEAALDVAAEATEAAWDARAAIEQLRLEIPELVAAAMDLQNEDEADHEEAETVELIEIPDAEPEPVTEVQNERTGFLGTLSRIIH